MKKRNNRFLAGTLAGLMMLTMLPVTALAAQEGADGDAASDTSNNIVNVVSDGKNGQPAENNDVNITENGGDIFNPRSFFCPMESTNASDNTFL